MLSQKNRDCVHFCRSTFLISIAHWKYLQLEVLAQFYLILLMKKMGHWFDLLMWTLCQLFFLLLICPSFIYLVCSSTGFLAWTNFCRKHCKKHRIFPLSLSKDLENTFGFADMWFTFKSCLNSLNTLIHFSRSRSFLLRLL